MCYLLVMARPYRRTLCRPYLITCKRRTPSPSGWSLNQLVTYYSTMCTRGGQGQLVFEVSNPIKPKMLNKIIFIIMNVHRHPVWVLLNVSGSYHWLLYLRQRWFQNRSRSFSSPYVWWQRRRMLVHPCSPRWWHPPLGSSYPISRSISLHFWQMISYWSCSCLPGRGRQGRQQLPRWTQTTTTKMSVNMSMTAFSCILLLASWQIDALIRGGGGG